MLLQKRKKKKKKAGVAEEPSSLTSELSDISLTDKEKRMEEDHSSDSDGSYCAVEDMPKAAESSSHLSPPETHTTGRAQSDSSGATEELISTSASPPVSEEADQHTEKEKAEQKKSKSTALDQNANMDQNANVKSSQMETDRQDEEPSSQQKNTEPEKHTDSGEAETNKGVQPGKTKKYGKAFVFW